MLNELLNKYLEDPGVLYIYETGLQIYGLFEGIEDRDFLIIIKDDYSLENQDEHFQIMKIKDWFDLVLNCEVLAWICACLPKKFVHKEHVKLLLQANPLKLRKNYNKMESETMQLVNQLVNDGNTLSAQKELWNLLKTVKFSNQIIENHKIVNFKEVAEDYKWIVDGRISDKDIIFDAYNKRMFEHINRFKEYTNGVLLASKQK